MEFEFQSLCANPLRVGWDCGWFYFKDVAKEIKTYIHNSTVEVQRRVI